MPVNPVDAATAVGSTSAINAASHAQIAALQRQLATLQKS